MRRRRKSENERKNKVLREKQKRGRRLKQMEIIIRQRSRKMGQT